MDRKSMVSKGSVIEKKIASLFRQPEHQISSPLWIKEILGLKKLGLEMYKWQDYIQHHNKD